MSTPTTATEKWPEVTRHDPCPICEKDHWCVRSPDGAVAGCMRRADAIVAGRPAFKTAHIASGDMYLYHLIDEPREPRPARPKPTEAPQRNVIADRAVYGLVVQTCAVLPAVALDDLVRRFGPAYGPQAAARFAIGYCDGALLGQALLAAGRRQEASAAGILYRDGTVLRSFEEKLVLPYVRDGLVHDVRLAGIKGRAETKEISLTGSYAEREVADLLFNHDALTDPGAGGVIHLAGGAFKTMALALAGLAAVGTRGEAELSAGQIHALRAAGITTAIVHIDNENTKEGQALSAGRRLGLPKAEKLAASGFTVLIAEPPREPGTPKVDPDALLRDLGPRAVRDYAFSAIPLATWRVLIGADTADTAPLLAERDALIAALRADVTRLGNLLRREQAEGAQLVTRITELETENAALDAAMRHPDQAAGVGALDLLDAANRAYSKGDVLTRDGKDYARVPFSKSEDRRSAKTNARGFKTIQEAGKVDAFTRTERIETPTYKGDVPIAYIHIPPDLRERRGAAVLAILPTPTTKKHGGRRTIEVPAEVAAQPNPVKRERELVTRWYDALSDEKIVTEAPARFGTDYWTARGEQRTREEIDAERVHTGYQPAPAKPWQPTQPALRLVSDPEPRQDAEVSATPGNEQRAEPRQDADINYGSTCRQDAEVSAEGASPPRCPDCGQPIAIGGYCMPHFMRHRDTNRHRAEALGYAYAAGN